MCFSRKNLNIKGTKFFLLLLIVIPCIVITIFFAWPTSPSPSPSFAQPTPLPISLFSKLNYFVPAHHFNKIKIGFVKPTFTDAAYNNKFYVFYVKYVHVSSKD